MLKSILSGVMDTVWSVSEGVRSITVNDIIPTSQDIVASSFAMASRVETVEDEVVVALRDKSRAVKFEGIKMEEPKAETKEVKTKTEYEENLDKEVEALINDMGREELRSELSRACDELQEAVNEAIKEQYPDKVEIKLGDKTIDMKDIADKATKAIKASVERVDQKEKETTETNEPNESEVVNKIKSVDEAKSCPALGMTEEDFDDINAVISFAYGDDGYSFEDEDDEDIFDEYTVEDLNEYQNDYDPEYESDCISEINAGEYMGEGGMSIIITDTQYIIPKDSELAQDEYVKSRGVEIGMGVYTNLVERNVKMITEDSYLVPTATTNLQDNYVFINRPEMKPWEYMTKEGKVLIKTKDGLVARKEEATVLEDEIQQELNEEQVAQLKAITENWNSNQSK